MTKEVITHVHFTFIELTKHCERYNKINVISVFSNMLKVHLKHPTSCVRSIQTKGRNNA